MKRLFTLSTALKVFVMLVLLGSMGNNAIAQVNCTITFYDYGLYYGPAYNEEAAKDITIGTVSPTYTFPGISTTSGAKLTTADYTGSVSFAVTAGTTAPVSANMYEISFMGMYVDWNKDGSFNTIPNTTSNPYGEFISGVQFNNSNYTTVNFTNGNLYVPGGVASGNYRARIIYGYNYGTTSPPALSQYPCGDWTTGTIYNLGYPYGTGASLDVTINVTNPASCFPPQPPTLTSATAGAATINWNAPSTITNNYQWVLVPAGGTATTTPIASGTTTGTNVTISSLSPITSYSFYVRANCSATDSSSWAGPLTFTTLAPQCFATPNTPAISNAPITAGVCAATQVFTLNATNPNTAFSGITYQWKTATTTTSTPPAPSAYSNISGATGLSYTQTPNFPVNYGNTSYHWYEIVPTCVLPPSTTYTGAASAPYSFQIQSYGIPYYQDFSTTATGALPQCFENDPADPLGSFKVQQSFTTADGTPFPSIVAAFPALPQSAKNAFFTIPPLALTANTTYTIQFNYGRSNITYPQRIQLYANTADPGTLNIPGAPFVTGGTKLFDSSYTFNYVGFEKLTFTPTTSATYYFSWYDSTKETSAPANGTAQGIGNIAIYIASPCVRPTAQPTALNFTSNVSTITGTFTPPATAPDKYLVVRTLGTTPLSGFTPSDGAYYAVNQAAGNGTVVYVGKYPTYTDLYLSSGVQYTYTIFAYNDLCSSGPLYDVTSPLTGTYQTTGGNTYVWNQTVAGDYQAATNWTPNRIVLDPSDVLVFSNGVADTVNNVPNQNIGQVQVINNTAVRIRANNSGAATLSMLATTTNTNVLTIDANSSLVSDGQGAALTLAFGGANAKATINGNLEVQNFGLVNILNFYNCTATVGPIGTLAAGGTTGTSTTAGITYTSPANLIMNGTYIHKYTTVVGGNIPLATWNTGSTVLISGYTTYNGAPGNLNNQTFYNFTYNCTNQTANPSNWNGIITTNTKFNALGTFTVASTGTGSWALGSNGYYIYNVGNFVQTGGVFDLGTSSPTTIYTQSFNVSGSFTQSGGTFQASNGGTTNGQILNFNGTSGVQNVSFYNAAPTGPITYRVSNYNGINLSGTGTLTSGSNFALNTGGGMRISTTSPNPVSTSLVLAYANTGTAGATLTFDTAANYTATATVWPVASGPFNVTVFTGVNNAVTIPFSRTIGGVLTFTSGDLDMGTNALTLGLSATVPGTITAVNGNGFIRLTTGSFTRWFPTSSLPTSSSALGASLSGSGSYGYFPVSYGPSNRNASVYFTSSAGVATGGTITVSHASSPGLVPVSISDGSYTIQSRSNASWTFSSTGLSLGSGVTMGLRITPANLFNPITPANLRLMKVSSVVDNYVTGGGTTPLVYAERNGVSLSDLTTGAWYVGANNADISGIWTAILTGNWSANATWDQNVQPPTGAICVINPKVVVNLDANSNTIKVLTNNGTLNVAANTLTIDSALYNNDTLNATGGTIKVNGNSTVVANAAVGITNSGLFNLAGGTVTLGPSGGGNKPFINNNNLAVSSGTLTINGNLLVNGYTTSSTIPNSFFTQSGGAIVVDGNAGGSAASSVGTGYSLVSLRSPNLNLTGGTLTITDPHQNSSSSVYAFEYNVNTTNAPFYNYNVPVTNLATAHTIIFGDGVSTDAGGNSNSGFKVNVANNSGRFNFGNVVVNGPSGTNRFVGLTNSTGILGNLTVNNGGQFWAYSPGANSNLYLKNNLTVNTGGVFSSYYLYLQDYSSAGNPSLPASQSQIVSGGGNFRNNYSAASSTGNFQYMYLCGGSNPTFLDSFALANTNSSWIYFANPGFPAGNSLLSHIYIPNISNYRIVEQAGAGTNGSATTGWVAGTYSKHANAGGFPNTYNIGDSLYFTPVTLGLTAGSAVTTGGDVFVRVNGGLEPNIASSTLNPLKTVKRYVTVGISAGNPIAFTNGGVTVNMSWVTADLPVGANTNIFNVAQDSIPKGSLIPTGNWAYPTSIFKLVNQITATGLNPRFTGNYVVGETCPPSTLTPLVPATTICAGTPDTLSAQATGLGLTYQWYHANGTPINGATNANYVIANPQQADSGAYYVVVTGICSAPLTSNVTTLTVNSLPVITTAPVSGSVCIGGNDTLSVTATGTAPLAYQWNKNGVAISGATSSTYTISNAVLGNAAGYTVSVSNSCSSVTSSIASVSVNPLPVASITALSSTTACQGSTVVLQAPAGNAGYVWTNNGAPSGYNSRFDTVNISGGVQVTVTSLAGCSATSAADSVKFILPPPASITTSGNPSFCLPGSVTLSADTLTGYSYTWLDNGTPNGSTGSYFTALASGSYQVIVKNSYNCPDTSTAVVVSASPVPVPTVTTAPAPGAPTTFCVGGSVAFTTPTNYLTYNWYDLNTSTTIATTQTTNAIFSSGSYELFVTDGNGCPGASSPVIVTVNALPTATAVAQGPTSICPGGSVTIAGGAGGDATVKYQWYQTGGFGGINGATNPTYTATNNGNYYVKITDTVTHCTGTSAPNVTVTIATPTATITPAGNQTLCQGATATLLANVGSGYQWYLNGTTPLTNTQALIASTGGTYTVAVTNAAGCTQTSAGKTITVVPNPVATATAGGPTTFCAGGTVLLSADTGTGLSYVWAPGGATTQTINASATGTYSVTVTNTNNCSTISNSVNVTAVPYPVATITSGGLPTSICTGSNVLLTAGPVGNSYLWLFNGSPLPYNDPNRTSISYPANQTGTYTVTVTNSTGCASTTSVANAISVFVNPIPTIQTLGPTTFCWGSSDILHVNAGTGAGLAYQWYNRGSAIVGATGPNLTVFDSGYYNVIVTVVGSCTQTSNNTDTVVVNQLAAPVITGSPYSSLITSSGSYAHYQWYLGTTPLVGDTLSSVNVYVNGSYHLVVTNSEGCTGVSNVFTKNTTGVSNVSGNNDITIYPNPVSTVVHIDASIPVDATISTIEGREALKQADAKTIDLTTLANGIYMIRVYDKTGTLLKVEKLVKASN